MMVVACYCQELQVAQTEYAKWLFSYSNRMLDYLGCTVYNFRYRWGSKAHSAHRVAIRQYRRAAERWFCRLTLGSKTRNRSGLGAGGGNIYRFSTKGGGKAHTRELRITYRNRPDNKNNGQRVNTQAPAAESRSSCGR
jgi:hypothetical protein